MAKSRKTAAATSEPQQLDAADAVIEHAKATLGAEVVNEPSQFPAEQPPQTDTNHAAQVQQKKPFQAVRGWTRRNKQPVQYRKLTDADLNIIFFKFVLPEGQHTLPADVKDILDAHKRYPESGEPTGLHFQNSGKHGKIWLIQNSTEGRAIADQIDRALQQLAAKHDLQQEQATGR